MILRSLIAMNTGGERFSVWSSPPAPTSTVVPPLRVDQRQLSIATPRTDRVERVVDADPVGDALARAPSRFPTSGR